MSDRTRQALAFVIAIGMVIAVASAPTVAQVADPSAEQVFEAAGYNADSVDGKHAVGYTTNRGKRAGKLVAANSNGFLPSNIVKPQWRVIQNMPASFTDGQIGWYEVANKPATFADNWDDEGVTGIVVRRYSNARTIAAGANAQVTTRSCDSGYKVVGGGHWANNYAVENTASAPIGQTWSAAFHNDGTNTYTITAYVICIGTQPWGNISAKNKSVKPAKVGK